MNHIINKETQFIHLGLIDYQEAWDYQEKLFKEAVDIKIANRQLPSAQHSLTPNRLVFCQHPHVYTLGKSGKEENLLLDESGLQAKEASYYKINRGGDITYHGPGQIVGYPILDLDNFFTDIHKYLRLLEEAIILTCADYGISAGRIDGLTGVWIDYKNEKRARKICAMGVKASRWVTMHGFAFNINTDLHYFGNIVPCGIDDKAVTSLEKELGKKQDLTAVELKLKRHLGELFAFEWV
ncbi:lipoyl(octanoyl) transferase [Reichenbachiella sp. 5M10]|uniref:lipoyl(octanoyl) transferase LipB n=1 Tax=Reichenbachiella sp. 5M10 TaxID=1889772 RepID=UPI000C150E2F|nr:lipoyl(octanoyl) transferase LipB [Reichenbachiella sp. 5M10]PIB36729.1 lipoyl(octanoyl) transferase [Reichenbachiella sp. 5M10]